MARSKKVTPLNQLRVAIEESRDLMEPSFVDTYLRYW